MIYGKISFAYGTKKFEKLQNSKNRLFLNQTEIFLNNNLIFETAEFIFYKSLNIGRQIN